MKILTFLIFSFFCNWLNAFKLGEIDLERLQNLIKRQISKDPYVQEVTFVQSKREQINLLF